MIKGEQVARDITVRKARIEDSPIVASHILLAMEDIVYNFIAKRCRDEAIRFLESLTKEDNNQYSYKNAWVAESDNSVVASALVYDGAKLEELRQPVIARVKTMFNRQIDPERETQGGEFYIDCVGVAPDQQGKGIGSTMFKFLIDEYVHKGGKTLGLLVDKENPSAKRLYLNLGFEIVGEKELAGRAMEHLQYSCKGG